MRNRFGWWYRVFTRSASFPRDLPVIARAFRRRKRLAPPANVWTKVDRIEGFLTDRESGLLYHAACHWPVAGPVIELGSFKGRSTTLLALAGRQVHAVDAWRPDNYSSSVLGAHFTPDDSALREFQANLREAGVEAQVNVHRGLTTQLAQGWTIPGAILFADAGHTYPAVQADLKAWLPHLMPSGLLLMHDLFSERYDGVLHSAGELLRQDWELVASGGTVAALVRRPFAAEVRPAHLGLAPA